MTGLNPNVPELAIAYLLWLVLPLLLVPALRGASWPEAVRSRTLWGTLGGAAIVQLVLWATVVPHAWWHPNAHDTWIEIEILHDGPWRGAALGAFHGYTLHAAYRLVTAALGGARWTLYVGPELLALAGAVALAVWVALSTGRARAAGLAGAAWMLWPVMLRLSGTTSFYVPLTALLMTALVLVEVHLRRADLAAVPAIGVATLLTMTTHVEMLVLAPVLVASWWLARAPRDALTTWRRPDVALLALGLGACLAPHLRNFVPYAQAGLPAAAAGDGLLARLWHTPAIGGILAGAALAAAVGATGFSRRLAGPARRVAVALLWGAGACLWLRRPVLSWPSGGDLAPAPGAWPDLSAFFHPGVSPALWTPFVMVGLAWAAVQRPALVGLAAVVTASSGLVHVPIYDSFASYVRMAPAAGWVWVALAALGADVVVSWLPWRGAALAAGVAWLGLALGGLGWVGARYPAQVEQALLQDAVAEMGPGAAVAMPTLEDLPAPVRAQFATRRRDYAPDWVVAQGARVVPLTAAVGADSPARWYLRTLACLQVITASDARAEGLPKVAVGARVFRTTPGFDEGVSRDEARDLRKVSRALDRMLPCLAPGTASCLVPGPEACALWGCAAGVSGPSAPVDWLDPACEAVERTLVLTPVIEREVPVPDADTEHGTIQHRHARIGLYRVDGRR